MVFALTKVERRVDAAIVVDDISDVSLILSYRPRVDHLTLNWNHAAMEISLILKIIMAIGVMIGAARIINEFSTGSKLKLREEYRFAKDFLSDVAEPNKLHHLAVERGYYALAGTSSIKVSDIAYLISLQNPDKSLKDYALSRRYVEFNEQLHRVIFRSKFKNKFSRLWRKAIHFTAYVMFAGLALSPLMLAGPYNLGLKFMLLALATIPSFGFFAFDSLRSFIKIQRAEALVKEQAKHAPLIMMKNDKRELK